MEDILGLNFDNEITNQINARQDVLNKRGNEALKYENTKTGFVRMASSINIDPSGSNNVLKSLQIDGVYSENELAKELVLQGGVLNSVDYQVKKDLKLGGFKDTVAKVDKTYIYSGSMNQGIYRGENIINKGAYGFGGQAFGYRPMPGIQDVQVTSFNNGSIRKAQIKIKAFTPQQLSLLELLYMKIGYSILLEWGHTYYIDNEGEGKNLSTIWSTPFRKFIDGGDDMDQQKLLIEPII